LSIFETACAHAKASVVAFDVSVYAPSRALDQTALRPVGISAFALIRRVR
jgi:hypothetical protein